MPEFKATFRDRETGSLIHHRLSAPNRGAAADVAGQLMVGELVEITEVLTPDAHLPDMLRRRRKIGYFHPTSELTAGELRKLIASGVFAGVLWAGIVLMIISSILAAIFGTR